MLGKLGHPNHATGPRVMAILKTLNDRGNICGEGGQFVSGHPSKARVMANGHHDDVEKKVPL